MMNIRRALGKWMVIVLLLAGTAVSVQAGGWATVTLDEFPADIQANESFQLGFTVWQHGNRPVHRLSDDWPIEPIIEATHLETGSTVKFEAQPTKKEGHFMVEVLLPEAGEWEWRIAPEPLAMTTEFASLMVLPATVVVPQGTTTNTALVLGGGLLGLLLLGTAVFLWGRRRTKLAAGVA